MQEIEKQTARLTMAKTMIGIILSIFILIIAQLLAFAISEIPLNLGVSGAICNVFAGLLYVLFAFLGAAVLCGKFLKLPMQEMRIPRFGVKSVWIVAAVLMPLLVLLLSMAVGGRWEINYFDTETTLATITGAVVFYGMATGMVEELIFRGIIMGCLEKRFGIRIAVIVPSVLFGLLHIIGNDLDFVSTIQLLIAGSMVGILFSLIAYESDSIWNNAIVHGIWNMTLVGGILHIGNQADDSSIFNFVFGNQSFLISGGDFGIEASVISVFVYFVFCVLATLVLKRYK